MFVWSHHFMLPKKKKQQRDTACRCFVHKYVAHQRSIQPTQCPTFMPQPELTLIGAQNCIHSWVYYENKQNQLKLLDGEIKAPVFFRGTTSMKSHNPHNFFICIQPGGPHKLTPLRKSICPLASFHTPIKNNTKYKRFPQA